MSSNSSICITDDSFNVNSQKKENDTAEIVEDSFESSGEPPSNLFSENINYLPSSLNKKSLDDLKEINEATTLLKDASFNEDDIIKSWNTRRVRKITSDSEEEDSVDRNSSTYTSYRKQKHLFDSDQDDEFNEKDNSEENVSNDSVSIKNKWQSFKSSINKSIKEECNRESEIDISTSSDSEVFEVPLKEDNVNNNKNKLKTSLQLQTINIMNEDILLEEKKKSQNETDNKYYCSEVEYSFQVSKVSKLRADAQNCKSALKVVNLNSLSDKGTLLKEKHTNLEIKLASEEEILNRMVVSTTNNSAEKKITWDQLIQNSACVVPKSFGKIAINTYDVQKTLTMDRLKNLHDSLATCPDENTFAENPKGLKIELMPHQKHALAWATWREGQKPRGGILADDMGLGKTLTMISLILLTKEMGIEDHDSESENEDEIKKIKNSKINSRGTLVVCAASLIRQWEAEFQKGLKPRLLTVEVYHGVKREKNSKQLSKYDIIITTYRVAQTEYEKNGPLYNIKWKRVILDEAHVIRNHISRTSISVCALSAVCRWALTGTPVHNTEIDLYALLKFLRCSPFDDLLIWKKWVTNKSAGGQERLNVVIKSILLRRTKMQLQDQGGLQDLPKKEIEEIYVQLDPAEKQVYEKVLLLSRTLFIEFLRRREEKSPDMVYFNNKSADNGKYSEMYKKISKMYGSSEIKSHHILVLLLRLRQICCHPSLIHKMLDTEICATEGIEETGIDIDLFEKLNNLNLKEEELRDESLDTVFNKLLSTLNPVFAADRPNEKLRTIQRIIEEKVIANNDKIIIVSQWTSMLNIIYQFLRNLKIKCEILDGKVPVCKRNDIVVNFNNGNTTIKVLLLSLSAGGVGLNLIGANHLLLVDLHWNPQLETQAQDRIYRVGQKKTVHIYKIITSDTIEEKVKLLQDKKLNTATNILSGARTGAVAKLSLDDLKILFNV